MNCLLVPTLALDLSLLDRLAASIDYPIQHKLIVNNGSFCDVENWCASHPGWSMWYGRDNLGVAASWNLAPRIWPGERCYLIVNDDCWFGSGQLKTICEKADAEQDNLHVLLSDTGFECFVWTRRGVDEVGYFDENFWPAYYEDNDMRIRLALAGNLVGTCNTRLNHGKPRIGGPNYEAVVKGCGLFNREYMLRKWGSLDRPMWPNPFNVKGRPFSKWVFDSERRKKMQPIWDTFLSMPNPSIYT